MNPINNYEMERRKFRLYTFQKIFYYYKGTGKNLFQISIHFRRFFINYKGYGKIYREMKRWTEGE